jgi:phosphoglucosamine mutase
MVPDGRKASEVLRVFAPMPQIMKNVRIANGRAPLELGAVRSAIADGETRLGKAGRLLVRKSGTEPLIRVMAEGENETLVGQVVDDVAAAIARAANA